MFYQLHHQEYLYVRSILKRNELDVYLYLMTQYPYSDSILVIDTAQIATELGYHRRTVQLALRRLEEVGLLDLNFVHFGYRQGKHGANARVNTNGQLNTKKQSESVDRQDESVDRNGDLGTHHTIYTDLNHTLPDPETRESTKYEQIQGEIVDANELSNLTTKEADKTVSSSSEVLDQLEESPWDSESEKCSAAVGASVPPASAGGLTAIGGCLPSVVVTEQGRSVEGGITVRFVPHSAEKPEESAAPTNQPKGSQVVNQSSPSENQQKSPAAPAGLPQGNGTSQQPPVTPKPATEYSRGQGFGSPSATERSRSQKKNRTAYSPTAYNWLPDGPWKCDDGKLDPHFHDWLARDWAERYGGDLTKRRADVLLHFKKDPANLVIRWAQYQEDYVKRFQNTQTLINHGRPIPPDYQEELTRNHRALTTTIPPEMSVTRSLTPALPAFRTDAGPASSPTPPPSAENGEADKTYQRPESFPDKQEAKAIFASLAQKAREIAEKRKAEQFSQTAGGV